MKRLTGKTSPIHTYPAGEALFHAQDGGRPKTQWGVNLWWIPPARRSTRQKALPAEMTSRDDEPEDQWGSKSDCPYTSADATRPRMDRFLQGVKNAGRLDSNYAPVLKSLEVDNLRQRDLRVRGGLLWRVAEGFYQMCIPDDRALKELVMRETHDASGAGHLGNAKTFERVRRRFYWPGMRVDVNSYCKSCFICQSTKPGRRQTPGELHPVPVPQRKWDVISVDFIT